MRKLKTWGRRGLLFLLCFAVVIFVRVALHATKFTRIRRLLVRPNVRNRSNAARTHIVVRYVSRAASLVPNATCMTQALSAQAILSWFGVPSNLVIGAASVATPQETEATDFHAWLVWEGDVVLGGKELTQQKFTPLSQFPSHSA